MKYLIIGFLFMTACGQPKSAYIASVQSSCEQMSAADYCTNAAKCDQYVPANQRPHSDVQCRN